MHLIHVGASTWKWTHLLGVVYFTASKNENKTTPKPKTILETGVKFFFQ